MCAAPIWLPYFLTLCWNPQDVAEINYRTMPGCDWSSSLTTLHVHIQVHVCVDAFIHINTRKHVLPSRHERSGGSRRPVRICVKRIKLPFFFAWVVTTSILEVLSDQITCARVTDTEGRRSSFKEQGKNARSTSHIWNTNMSYLRGSSMAELVNWRKKKSYWIVTPQPIEHNNNNNNV